MWKENKFTAIKLKIIISVSVHSLETISSSVIVVTIPGLYRSEEHPLIISRQ